MSTESKNSSSTALEKSSDGLLVGKDPRKMEREELRLLGHDKTPPMKIIRAKCIDCSGGSESEVRKCVAYDCVLWPYRMGKNVFSDRKGNPNGFKGQE